MEFQPARLRGLLKAKNLRPDEVEGFNRGTVSRWENGHGKPTADSLAQLATALDATMNYFYGLQDDFGEDYGLAAAKMSFAFFERDTDVAPEQKSRCRRVFGDDRLRGRWLPR
jgi:transcriptional regulator with XRE-family HTH domain